MRGRAGSHTKVRQRAAKSSQKTEELSALFEISKVLASALDLDMLLKRVLEMLINVLELADAGAILLFDRSLDKLAVRSAWGYDFKIPSKVHFRARESMASEAFHSGQAKIFATPKQMAEALGDMTPQDRFHLGLPQSAICVPLNSEGIDIGVLILENQRSVDAFSRHDLEFIEDLADLTALAIYKAQLLQENEQKRLVEEANRLKSELIATLAHEMRTPLASIKGYATALLIEDAEWDEATKREFLEIIDDESDNLQDIISDLLESSIIDAGFLRIDKQPAQMPKLVQEAIDEVARRTDKHRFMVDFPPNFPIVEVDPHRLMQVLHNLLDNAVKYSPKGGLVVVRGEVDEGEVIISVADQGVGIAPEHLNRLFDKFYRVKSALGRHVAGSGLGLPIARTIVESHGGRIWAESESGKGSTFYFSIPLAESEA